MKINYPVPTALSNLTIDVAKNWGGFNITNLGNLQFEGGLFKIPVGGRAYVRDLADVGYIQFACSYLLFTSGLAASGLSAYVNTHNVDDSVIIIRARDSGAGLTEIARILSAADPYWQHTKPPVHTPTARPAALVTGHVIHNTANNLLELYDGVSVKPVMPRTIYKTADETVNNSAALQNDDHLLFAVNANEEWIFKIALFITAVNMAADLQLDLTCPAAGVVRFGQDDAAMSTGGVTTAGIWAVGGGTLQFGAAMADNMIVKVTGHYLGGANAGNVQLRWAQAAAHASDLTVARGSFLQAWRIK